MNAVMNLDGKQAEKGVVVHSSGNHAGAAALAAKIYDIPAYIVLPTDTPQVREFKKHVDARTALTSVASFLALRTHTSHATFVKLQMYITNALLSKTSSELCLIREKHCLAV